MRLPFGWLATLLVGILVLMTSAPSGADSAPPSTATVAISDKGVQPAAVVIAPGGSVTWTNQGAYPHSATSSGGALFPFDTFQLNPGQTGTVNFGAEGVYYYSSLPDCLSGNYFAGFNCTTAYMVVVSSSMDAANQALASVAAPSPTPSPTAPAGPVVSATVKIDDKGAYPRAVTVYQGGSVWLLNVGFNVHTATFAGSNAWPGFDSGGLSTGQGSSFQATQPGTYAWTSQPDCMNGNKNPLFDCGPYTITVVSPNVPAQR